MQIRTLSAKQREIMAFAATDELALVCDGSVRSGKTITMAMAFLLWAMARYDRTSFAICGKTVQSAERNILAPLLEIDGLRDMLDMQYKRSARVLTVRCGGKSNSFYLFGGKDESSYMLIQGITLAGVLFDEVALMPRSFVEQALSRAISYAQPKYFFNCNPDSPDHWFYKSWILPERTGVRRIHFCLEDNPILTPEMIERTKSMYSGVFYERYILGRWVVAEGLVYPGFGDGCIVDEVPRRGRYYISIDYGTQNPFSAGLWCWADGVATRIREYYYSGRDTQVQRTDEDYCDAVAALAEDLPVECVVVDPSAASFIAALRRRGKFTVRKARNDVLDGIRLVASYLQTGKIKVHRSCADCIREFRTYRWDAEASRRGRDAVIKDNDHAMDDLRYFSATVLPGLIGGAADTDDLYGGIML